MGLELKPGTRLRSAVCEAEFVVVRSSLDTADLRCGGHPMVGADAERPLDVVLDPAFAEGATLGKRYTDEAGDLELLCTKRGDGSPAVGDQILHLKSAKPLPSSD